MENQIVITPEAKENLAVAAKWAKFIAIINFIFIGFAVMLAIFFLAFGTALSAHMMPPFGKIIATVYPIIFLVVAAISFPPAIYLYRFAVRTQLAVVADDSNTMAESINWIKKYFNYNGVLLIIVLCFYALAVVGGIIAGIVHAF